MNFLFKKTLLLYLLLLQADYVFSKAIISPDNGITVGTFTVLPLIEIENEYDSNVFKTTKNIKDDFIIHIKPSLKIRSNWSRHAVDLKVKADINQHQHFEQEDFENINIDIFGRIDVKRDSYASAQFHWSQESQERGTVDNDNTDSLISFTTRGSYFGYEHLFNRLRLNISNNFKYLDFGDNMSLLNGISSADNLRNRFLNTVDVRLGYVLNPRVDTFLYGNYKFSVYDSKVDRNNFNRNSEEFEIGAGIAFDFTGKLFGDISLGYLERYPEDSRLLALSSQITGGVQLKWEVTRLTTVSLEFDNKNIETTQFGASHGMSNTVKISINHKLYRSLLLDVNGGYTHNEYQSAAGGLSDREDETIVLGVKAKYSYNRYLYLQGEYIYRERSSNNPLNDYIAHRILFSLGLEI